MHWKLTTAMVCAYGIVKEFRPATPFLTPFLAHDPKNFTNVEIYSQIYPVWTYSYFVSLIPVFFLTDFFKYKPIVILEALSLLATWTLLVWGHSVWQMQLMQAAFGLASSSEVAYYSYTYAVVHKKHFKRVTSYIRSAALVGKFFAFSLAQLLVSTGVGSYLLLNEITLVAVALIVPIALLLPSVRAPPRLSNKTTAESIPVATVASQADEAEEDKEAQEIDEVLAAADEPSFFVDLRTKFSVFLTNRQVLGWSIWWALTSCGMYQMYNYAQPLWSLMQHEGQYVGNGFVECLNTLIASGATMTFLLQYWKVDWKRFGGPVFFGSSIASAVMLLAMAQTTNVFVAYAMYLSTSSMYHILIAVASNIIASQLNSASYSLIFGFNTFLALLCQSVLTFTVADERGLALDIRSQFLVYSGYFFVVASVFCVPLVAGYLRKRPSASET